MEGEGHFAVAVFALGEFRLVVLEAYPEAVHRQVGPFQRENWEALVVGLVGVTVETAVAKEGEDHLGFAVGEGDHGWEPLVAYQVGENTKGAMAEICREVEAGAVEGHRTQMLRCTSQRCEREVLSSRLCSRKEINSVGMAGFYLRPPEAIPGGGRTGTGCCPGL